MIPEPKNKLPTGFLVVMGISLIGSVSMICLVCWAIIKLVNHITG